ESAMAVYRSMQQIVDTIRILLIRRVVPSGIAWDILDARPSFSTAQADGDPESHHMLPERRIGGTGRHVIGHVCFWSQVLLPVVHRHVGKRIRVGIPVRCHRRVGVSLVTWPGDRPAGQVVRVADTYGATVPVTIRCQNGEVLPTRELILAGLGTVWSRGTRILEVLPGPI